MSPPERRAPAAVLLSMAVVGTVSLVLQIALTRVMSVTVNYHAAFAVIALVMLGIAASATSVFVRSNGPTPPTTDDAVGMLQRASALLGFGTVAYVWMDVVPFGPAYELVHIVTSGALFFSAFWLTGWVIAFLLGQYHADIGRVYWSDLSGAALGCLLMVPLLDNTSALNVVLLCGTGCAVAGLLLSTISGAHTRRAGAVAAASAALTIVALIVPGVTGLRVAKRDNQADNTWVEWNHLARVNVTPHIAGAEKAVALLRAEDPTVDAEAVVARWAMGWGMSSAYTGDVPDTIWVQLDADAGTQIIEQGPSRVGKDMPFLEADVTSAAHHLKHDDIDRAFVIGGGGGRDILAALHYGAGEVVVAELNPGVVRAVDDTFADYSGGTYSLPQVDLHLGEARSTLTRVEGRFDLIQMSMIDTWASSMAGAMVLSENALYTQEAFELYLSRLTPSGMATVSRWYHPEGYAETARVVVLMEAALRAAGVAHPEQHVAVVVAPGGQVLQVATLVMKRSPFTADERAELQRWSATHQFRVLHPDRDPSVTDPVDVNAILTGDQAWLAATPFDLSAPTDNRPFFFNTRHPIRSWIAATKAGDSGLGSPSSLIIVLLMVLMLAASRLIVWAPLREHEARKPEAERLQVASHWVPLTYFAGIGLGFMWIELAIIQRYIVFLGHPTYALSVVLFALLMFGALGSAASDRLGHSAWKIAGGSIVVGGLLTAFVVPSITDAALYWATPARIALAVALVAPMGFVMGMMYPTGVRLLERAGVSELVPWVWAVNGIAGVFASVMGMLVAIVFGYTAVVFLGIAAYVATVVAASRGFAPTVSE